MTKEYKSIEKRIFVDSGIKDFLVYGGKGLYYTVATIFRIPTGIRKIINNQTIIKMEDLNNFKTARSKGLNMGVVFGIVGNAAYLLRSLDEASKNNYIPLAVFGATNLASGLYELGRLKQSKQENLEMKAQEDKK